MLTNRQNTPFIKGLILGGAIAAAALMGYAYGTEEGHDVAREELEASCQVHIGLGQLSLNSCAYNNRVMVGVRGDYFLCSEVTVECPDLP